VVQSKTRKSPLLRSRDSASALIKAFGSRIKNASVDKLD
jgi:hypothetical protein